MTALPGGALPGADLHPPEFDSFPHFPYVPLHHTTA